ncbi:hypothetical protein ACP6PL_13885 [Dapis sp. BLCC M126]|uniref:hypothetical protein n=1 Tax=Dapis sp. BLCC M126 TaxID=3400189 RepID=UPI003CF53FA3
MLLFLIKHPIKKLCSSNKAAKYSGKNFINLLTHWLIRVTIAPLSFQPKRAIAQHSFPQLKKLLMQFLCKRLAEW